MNKISNFVSPQKIISKENALLVSILAISAIFAIAVFAAGEFSRYVVTSNASAGGPAGTPTLNQSYCNYEASSGSNCSINISLIIGAVNASYVLQSINLTSVYNTSGWNITGTGPYNNTSRISQISYTGIGTAAGFTQVNFSNASGGIFNYTVQSTGAGANVTLSFGVGFNFSTQGIYNFTLNFSVNNTGAVQHNNTTFAIVADWTNPVMNATYTNVTAQHFIQFPNQTVNITFNVSDRNLNFSQLDSDAVPKLNITFYNATGNTTTAGINHIILSNISNSTSTLNNREWNFSVALLLNKSMATNEYNLTAQITLVDNATNSVTRYWSGWVMFDNQTPTVTSINPANSSSGYNIAGDITVNFHEMVNGNTLNNTTVMLFANSTGTMVAAVVTYSNTSNKGVLTINPGASLSADTFYTVNISSTINTSVVRDMAGNSMPSYTSTFKTAAVVAQPSGGGSSTSGGGTATGTVGSIDSSTSSLTTSVSVGGSVDIEIQVAAPTGGGSSSEDHTMTIVSVTGTVVKLKFTSDPVFVDVNVGQTKYVDINGDSINDVRVTVNSVSGSTADVTVELLPSAKGTAAKAPYVPSTPSVSQPTAPTEPTAPSETAPAAKKPMNTKLLLIVVGVLAIVAAAYWFTQKELSPSKRSV